MVREELPQDRGQGRNSQGRYGQLASYTADLFSWHSPTGAFQDATPAAELLLGYTVPELLALPPEVLYHPEDLESITQFWGQFHHQATVPPCQYRVRHRDGHYLWLETQGQVLGDCHQGKVPEILAVSREITTRKTTEAHLRLLAAIALRIRRSLNLEEILHRTVEEVRQFLQTDRVGFYRFDEKGGGGILAESVEVGIPSMAEAMEGLPLQHLGIWNHPPLEGTAIADAHPLTCGTPPSLTTVPIQASLVVPIAQESHTWGLLIAHHCRGPKVWRDADVEFLKQLAVQVAIAIQQSELYHQVQNFNATLKQEAQEQTQQLRQVLDFEATLKQITEKVRDSLEEAQILETAVQALAVVLGVSSCNAAMYDLEEGTSTICYEYVTAIPASQGRVSKLANFPEIYQQLLRGLSFQFCSLLPNPARGRVAMLTCPIQDDKGVLGDLWLVKGADQAFSDQEIRLSQHVTTQCAIAIRQARLYQAAQRQVEELEKLNQLKDDFLSTISHELKTPMANMKMAIHMLQMMSLPERQSRYLKILQDECDREANLINNLLDLQRLEAGAYRTSQDPLALREWLSILTNAFYSRAQANQQHLQVDCPDRLEPLLTDQTCLERIIVELLNNACKYTQPGGEIHLRVKQTPKRKNNTAKTIFTVANQAEIPPSEMDHIFQKFYRIPNGDPWKQGGTGLGLALVKKLVEQLGGKITVQSDHGWVYFTVSVPTHPITTISPSSISISP